MNYRLAGTPATMAGMYGCAGEAISRATIVIVIFASVIGPWAQPASAQIASTSVAWQNAKWDPDDVQYLRIRKELESLSRRELFKRHSRYRAKLIKGERDSLLLFGGMWSALLLSEGQENYDEFLSKSRVVEYIDAVHTVNDSESYEFSRAKFLMLVRFDLAHRNYLPIARRLHKKDPKDRRVLDYYLRILQPQRFPDDRKEGLVLVKEIDRLPSPKPWEKFRVGAFYYFCWQADRSATFKNLAMQYLDQAVALTTNKKFRGRVAAVKKMLSK